MSEPSQRVLQAVRELLQERAWDEVSLSEVAAEAGVSRQTVYNEFGSRSELARLHVETLVEALLVDVLPDDVLAEVRQVGIEAMLKGVLTSWLSVIGNDKALQSARGPGLFRGAIADEIEVLDAATGRLADRYCALVPQADRAQGVVMARVVVRQTVSYLVLPPSEHETPAADLAAALAPYVERLLDHT